MAGESLGQIAIELEEKREQVVAYFAFGKRAWRRGVWV